jgi:hypothetical protein
MTFAFVGTASAQDLDGDGIDDAEEETTDDGMGGGETTDTTTTDGGGGDGDGGGMAGGGEGGGAKMAIVAEYNAASDTPIAHFLFDMSGNYLDIEALFSFVNTSPEVGDSTTVIDLGVGVGYRMYKDMDGRIHPYLSPNVVFALSTDEAAGEPKVIGVGADLGVDFMLFDQFTLGAALGGGLQFLITEGGNELSIFTYTTSINATYWWGS